MFAALGLGVAAYTAFAAATGRVWARSGPGARLIARETAPGDFWVVIAIYAGLAVALVFFF